MLNTIIKQIETTYAAQREQRDFEATYNRFNQMLPGAMHNITAYDNQIATTPKLVQAAIGIYIDLRDDVVDLLQGKPCLPAVVHLCDKAAIKIQQKYPFDMKKFAEIMENLQEDILQIATKDLPHDSEYRALQNAFAEHANRFSKLPTTNEVREIESEILLRYADLADLHQVILSKFTDEQISVFKIAAKHQHRHADCIPAIQHELAQCIRKIDMQRELLALKKERTALELTYLVKANAAKLTDAEKKVISILQALSQLEVDIDLQFISNRMSYSQLRAFDSDLQMHVKRISSVQQELAQVSHGATPALSHAIKTARIKMAQIDEKAQKLQKQYRDYREKVILNEINTFVVVAQPEIDLIDSITIKLSLVQRAMRSVKAAFGKAISLFSRSAPTQSPVVEPVAVVITTEELAQKDEQEPEVKATDHNVAQVSEEGAIDSDDTEKVTAIKTEPTNVIPFKRPKVSKENLRSEAKETEKQRKQEIRTIHDHKEKLKKDLKKAKDPAKKARIQQEIAQDRKTLVQLRQELKDGKDELKKQTAQIGREKRQPMKAGLFKPLKKHLEQGRSKRLTHEI